MGGAATFWDGRYGYVLGGVVVEAGPTARTLDDIVRFDPASGSVSTRPSRLPTGLSGAVAVWDGAAAYLFGGSTDPDGTWNRIVRFDPATGRSEVMPQVLPIKVTHAYAAWDGQHAYIVGGYLRDGTSAQFGPSDRIIRFTPATGEVRTMATRQPVLPGEARGAVWDGRRVLIPVDPSGAEGGLTAATVVAYDPVADKDTTLPSTFSRLAGAKAIWACSQLLVSARRSLKDFVGASQ